MFWKKIVLLGVCLNLLACSAVGEHPEVIDKNAIVGSWQIVEIDGAALSIGADISFSEDGQVGGSDGCNRFVGSYTMNSELLVGPLASTKRLCIDETGNQESLMVLKLLAQALSVEVKSDSILVLNAVEQSASMTIHRVE